MLDDMSELVRLEAPVDRDNHRAELDAMVAHLYRLTEAEVVALLRAACGVREARAIFIGVCAGLRNAELRGLQGRHFERLGWIWVSADIAKGGRERWVP